MNNVLSEILLLQRRDELGAAELLLREFVAARFALEIAAVQLTPRATSLNSVNGTLVLRGGQRLFFKTHIEEQGTIDEYYNVELLQRAGYPALAPRFAATEAGQQILLYPEVRWPTLFDLVQSIESGAPAVDPGQLLDLLGQADDQLLAIYRSTFEPCADQRAAPVHQLFWHRLFARLDTFYGGQQLQLADRRLAFEELCARRWVINGRRYPATLGALIERARALLDPAAVGPASVVGHGDAHNGNLFVDVVDGRPRALCYFDPAFAGRHDPLLDLAKPLFHNIFARWMYIPDDVAAEIAVDVTITASEIVVDHSFRISPFRAAVLQSKLRRILAPLLDDLRAQGMLRPDWEAFLRAALLCCPLLTKDIRRYPPAIQPLALAMAIAMASAPETGEDWLRAGLGSSL